MQGAQCEIGRKLSRRLTARQITCVIEEERVLAVSYAKQNPEDDFKFPIRFSNRAYVQ